MKFGLNKGCMILLGVILFGISCGDADLFDGDKWSGKVDGWTLGVKGKVAHGKFTLWDVINQGDDDVVVKEGNNLIIQYLEPNIYEMPVTDVFKLSGTTDFEVELDLPGIEVGAGEIPEDIDVPRFTLTTDLPAIPNECELKVLALVGELKCDFPYNGFDYEVKVTFENMVKDDVPYTITKKVTQYERQYIDNWTDGVTVNLNQDKELRLGFKVKVLAGGTVGSVIDGKVHVGSLNFNLSDLDFKEAIGKIKVSDPVQIDPGQFDLNVDFLDEIGGSFKFAKPELNIILRNEGIGVPLSLSAEFDGKNEDQEVTLKLNDGKELYTLGKVDDVDTLGFNAGNSNIVDFLSLPPQGEIEYRGEVNVNPKDAEDNIVRRDGKAALDAYVRIPFTLSAESLSYKDTLDDIDIDQKYADKIETGVIKIVATNGLPLNIEIPYLTLMDENGEKLVIPAEKDNQGLKANKQGVIKYSLNRERASFLGKTENILLEVMVSTPDNQVVTVAADAVLDFQLLLEVRAVIDDYDDF